MLATGAAAAEPLRLAVPPPTLQNVDAKAGDFYALQLSQDFGAAGAKVITPKDMETVIGIERQRQLLACDESSCLAELAAALGADGVLIAAIGRFDGQWQVTMKIIETRQASTLAQFSRRVGSESAVLDAISDGAREMVPAAATAMGRELVSKPAARSTARIWLPIAAVGAVAAIAGAVLAVLAMFDHNALVDPGVPLTASEGMARVQRGQTFQTAGAISLSVGGALLLTGVVLGVALRGDF
jgi:hypothetical protein